MQEFIKKGMEIIFVKVDSHTGDLFNELVDEKCKEVLKIDSDKVVEKWLKNKEIKVNIKGSKRTNTLYCTKRRRKYKNCIKYIKVHIIILKEI